MPFPLAAALALMIGGTALGAKADRDALKKRSRLTDQMMAYRREQSKKTMDEANRFIGEMDPRRRDVETSRAEDELRGSMGDTVNRLQAFNLPTRADAGSDYDRVSATAADRVAGRTRRLIEQLAIAGAPSETSFDHRMRFGRTAGAIDAANLASQNVSDAYQMDISNVMPNWKQKLVGSLLRGGGMAMAMGGPAPASGGGPGA